MASIQHLIRIETPNGNLHVYRKLRDVQRLFDDSGHTHQATIYYKGKLLTAKLNMSNHRWIVKTTEDL